MSSNMHSNHDADAVVALFDMHATQSESPVPDCIVVDANRHTMIHQPRSEFENLCVRLRIHHSWRKAEYAGVGKCDSDNLDAHRHRFVVVYVIVCNACVSMFVLVWVVVAL